MVNSVTQKAGEELILAYKKTQDDKIKQEIILRYSYIVKMIAMQMRGVYLSFTEIDDIINEGIIALIQAIDKFDPEKNVKFESYASLRIRGTIIDLARKQDWLPRGHRKTAKLIDNAQWELYNKLNRHPSDQEMADYLQLDIKKYRKLLNETNLYNVLSLDTLMSGINDDSPFLQPVDTEMENMPEQMMQKKEMSQMMQEAIGTLRENEQLVISLYYRKELTMKEIAKILGVQEPRISQIHANALRKMRMYMQKYMQDPA